MLPPRASPQAKLGATNALAFMFMTTCQTRRSWNMSRVRGKHTAPEKRVRSLLHRLGFRFRLSRKLAVDREEVGHYCLWHDCAGFQNPSAPGRRSGVDR